MSPGRTGLDDAQSPGYAEPSPSRKVLPMGPAGVRISGADMDDGAA